MTTIRSIDLAAAAVLLSLTLGCGGSPKNAARSVTLQGSVPIAEPHFIAGGAPGNMALACGGEIHRLNAPAASVVASAVPAHDYIAVYFDPSGGTHDRYLVRTDNGPALLDGERASTLPGWPDGIPSGPGAFSPDGRFLAVAPSRDAGSNGPALILYKFPLESFLEISTKDLALVSLMTWSADGRCLLVADRNNRISIFKPPKKKPVFVQDVDPGAEGRITAIDLSPDGDWFLMAANAIRMRAWQLPFMNTQLKAWGRVEKVFFAGDVSQVITIDETNVAIHWLVNYGNVKTDTTLVLGDVAALGVPAGGSVFYALGRDGIVKGYRSGDLEPLGEAPGVSCPTVAGSRAPADSAAGDSAPEGRK